MDGSRAQRAPRVLDGQKFSSLIDKDTSSTDSYDSDRQVIVSQATSSRRSPGEDLSLVRLDNHLSGWNSTTHSIPQQRPELWQTTEASQKARKLSIKNVTIATEQNKWKENRKRGNKRRKKRNHKKKRKHSKKRGKSNLRKHHHHKRVGLQNVTDAAQKDQNILNRKNKVRLEGEPRQKGRRNTIHKGKRKRHKLQNQMSARGKAHRQMPFKESQPRWKRLSHHPRRPHYRRNHMTPHFNHWVRNLHRHHEHFASSLRDRLHNHIERSRRQWLRSMDPQKMFRDSFPSFPEISKNILNSFPPLHPPLTHPFKHLKNTVTNRGAKYPEKRVYRPTYQRGFGYGSKNWGRKAITRPPNVRPTTPKSLHGQRQFIITRSQTERRAVILTTTTPKPWNTNFFTRSTTEAPSTARTNSVFPESREEFIPSTKSELYPDQNNVDSIESPPTLSFPKSSSHKPQEEDVSHEASKEEETHETSEKKEGRAIYIPYGNDVTKGLPNQTKDFSSEQEWEWIPLNSRENDVNYESDDRDVGTEWEEEEGREDREKEEEEESEGENEIEGEREDETVFDIERCLECPPKRTVHAPRGRDYVPFLIPTPKNTCHSRSVLRFHVEVNPGNPEFGALLSEGHYFINVSILGGNEGKTPLKTCTYDYEVQVYKCPPLPFVTGGSAECSAGQAWGSKCLWKCDPGKRLIGSSLTTCGGDKNAPSWSHSSPKCKDTGCPIPKGIEGVALSCIIPIPHESLHDELKSLKLYPEGSTCHVRCASGLTSRSLSSEAVTISKCQPTGKWLPDISTCCVKKKLLPKPSYGECRDINVQLRGAGIVHLIPPRFITADGTPAHVWCSKDTVRHEGRHCRTCKAHDKVRGLTGSCHQCINVSTQLGCPSIKAPLNGSLECKNTPNGDILCKILCKDGFLLPPKLISSGKVRCLRGMSLWDFQSYRNELLPPCVLR